jgi:hypothetical protein
MENTGELRTSQIREDQIRKQVIREESRAGNRRNQQSQRLTAKTLHREQRWKSD